MAADLRSSFHNSLDQLDHKLASMFDLVAESLTTLAHIPTAHSAAAVAALVERDQEVDALRLEVEQLAHWHLARQQAMGRDLRLLMTAIHIAPELERSHDLVVHVARDAPLLEFVCSERQAEFDAMAVLAAGMWEAVAQAFRQRDPLAANALELEDERMDQLQRAVLTGLASDTINTRCAINLALLARFYERLGDHAVHLAERIRFLAEGDGGAGHAS